jgi:ankyrin repeat protein
MGQAKTLMKLGANVAVLDVEGKTPLHWAVSRCGKIHVFVPCAPKSSKA